MSVLERGFPTINTEIRSKRKSAGTRIFSGSENFLKKFYFVKIFPDRKKFCKKYTGKISIPKKIFYTGKKIPAGK